MPSQQMPQSSKFETLPADLKEIAERLVRKKFNIGYEPEVVERKPKKRKNPIDSLEPLIFEIRDVTSMGRCEIFTIPSDLPRKMIERRLMDRMRSLSQYYGGRYEVRNLSPDRALTPEWSPIHNLDFNPVLDTRPGTNIFY